MRKALGFSFPFDSHRHGNSSNRRPCRKLGLGVQAARKQSVFLSSCSNSTGGQSQMKASVARIFRASAGSERVSIRKELHTLRFVPLSRIINHYLRIVFCSGPGEDFLKSQVVSKRVPFQRVSKSESEMINVRGRR